MDDINAGIDDLSRAESSATNALNAFERAKAALYLPDGTKQYSDEEHERRYQAAWAPLQAATENAQAVARRVQEAAEVAQARLSGDPFPHYDEATQKAIEANRWRVQEDFNDLPLEQLAEVATQALKTGDLASLYLVERYGVRRLRREEPAARAQSTRGGLRGYGELSMALEQVRERLVPDKVRKQQERATAVRRRALDLDIGAQNQLRQASGETERLYEALRQQYRSMF